jgi:hypothetical protein
MAMWSILRTILRCLVIATVMTAGIAGCSQSRPAQENREGHGWAVGRSSAGRALLVCNGSTQRCPDTAHYVTVQGAVDAARPGDWVLIWPGVYHETLPLIMREYGSQHRICTFAG